jgi:hypothetical protein
MHDAGQIDAGSWHIMSSPNPGRMGGEMIDRPDRFGPWVLRIQEPSDALDYACDL